MDKEKLKLLLCQAADVGKDAVYNAVSDWVDSQVQRAAEEERMYAIQCAAAALADAGIADAKIVDLLHKYYRLNEHEAAAALGEGRLMMAKRKANSKVRHK